MYDELIKRLREPCQYENCVLCQEAADAIEELSKPRWIPVTERLPEQDVSVIGAVYHTDLIIAEDGELIEEAYARCQAEAAKRPRGELCFYGEDGWYGCDGFPMICAPSCWMPLPEPPKNEVSTAQPKQKTYQWGRQILFNDGCGGVKVGYACPACKTYVPNKGNHCSNCGAKFTKR